MKNQTKTWRRVRLGEVAGINARSVGSNFPYQKISYIDISSVGSGELLCANEYDLAAAPGRAKRLVFNGDTILSTVRPNRRSFLFIKNPKENIVVSTGFVVLSPKTEINSRFLYYWVTRQQFTDYLDANTKGSAYPAVSPEIIANAEILVPPINEQKRIAGVLSALDDKIELNNKISQTLEQVAQAVFKEKFVLPTARGVLPKGWKVKKLGDVAYIQWGDTTKTKASYKSVGYPAYSASGADGFLDYFDFDKTGVVVSAIGANCGATWLALDKWSCIKNTIRFWSKSEGVSTEYLFLATNNKAIWPRRGSAQPFITLGEARNVKIIVPPKNLMDKARDCFEKVFVSIEHDKLENQKLAELRDYLLPKLMSGEITIKN